METPGEEQGKNLFFLRERPGRCRGIPGNPGRPHRRGTGGKQAEKFFYGVPVGSSPAKL